MDTVKIFRTTRHWEDVKQTTVSEIDLPQKELPFSHRTEVLGAGENVGRRDHWTLLVRVKTVTTVRDNNLVFPEKSKLELPYDPAMLAIYPQEMKLD